MIIERLPYSTMQDDLQPILKGTGVAVIRDHAFLRISGSDATRWLNGMVTNSIQSLEPGQGNYNFLLNAQGRIQGECTIYREPGKNPTFLLETSGNQIDTIQQLLDKFIIMDDVALTRAYEQEESLLVLGADAPALLQQLGLPDVDPLRLVLASIPDGDVLLLSAFPANAPAYEIRAASALISSLLQKAVVRGAKNLSADDVEALRILSGTPRFSVDIRDRDLPQETNQAHALHFAKGCYLGQEIVERIRSRGQVHRLLTPFLLEGTLPDLPAPLEANGKPAGEITSATRVGNEIFALGYARREALESKAPLTYAGGTAKPRTIPTPQRIQQHET